MLREDEGADNKVNYQEQQTSDSSNNVTEVNNKFSFRLLMKILMFVGGVCFFLPFMSMSCMGKKFNITGMNMIFGNNDLKEQLDSIGKDYGGKSSALANDDFSFFNWFICIALIIVVVTIILMFVYKAKEVEVIGFGSIAALALLILFRVTAISYFDLEEAEALLNIKYEIGFYLTTLVFIANVVLMILQKKKIIN